MASNQTPQKYKDLASQNALGTAVFLQVGASGETLVTFEQSLSYEICMQRGQRFAAFKWVPRTIASYEAVVGSRCRLVGEQCSISCDADGCLCDTARQQCADSSGNSQTPPGTGNLSSGTQGDESGAFETVTIRSRR